MSETGAVWRGHFGLSATALKIIAMLVMLLDHAAAIFLVGHENYLTLRTVGRVSFPIFCFLIAEGMCYTRDIRRYALRLGLFALLSEIPYDLAFHGVLIYRQSQNVFFTLFLAVAAGVLNEWRRQKKGKSPEWLAWGVTAAGCGILLWAGDFLHTDYGTKGVALILIFYFGRQLFCLQGAASRGGTSRSATKISAISSEHPYSLEIRLLFAATFMYICWRGKLQIYALAALPILLLYNGKKGTELPKYLFYFFYPLHLLLLYLLHCSMG